MIDAHRSITPMMIGRRSSARRATVLRMEWSTERIADQYRAEIRDIFKGYDDEHREDREQLPEDAIADVPEVSDAWILYERIVIHVDADDVRVILPAGFTCGESMIRVFEQPSVAWTKVIVGTAIVDGSPRLVLDLLLVDSWDDDKANEAAKKKRERRTIVGSDDLRARIRDYQVDANRKMAHREMAVVDTDPPVYSCKCGFKTCSASDPDGIRLYEHIREASSPQGRIASLCKLLRGQVAGELGGDLDGGELLKEVWEQCESNEERRAVRGELRSIIESVLLGA